MATAANVSVGKPKTGGAISVAPVGTPLPTDATTDLDAAFRNLGFVSDDGLTNSSSMETEGIKAWGGQTVLTTLTSKDDKYKFTLIEALNVEVLKAVYGSANVSVNDLTGLITIKVNASEPEAFSWVVDMIMTNGALKRIVIPNAKISEVADVVYKDNEPIGYESTLACNPDDQDNTHYEYILPAA